MNRSLGFSSMARIKLQFSILSLCQIPPSMLTVKYPGKHIQKLSVFLRRAEENSQGKVCHGIIGLTQDKHKEASSSDLVSDRPRQEERYGGHPRSRER